MENAQQTENLSFKFVWPNMMGFFFPIQWSVSWKKIKLVNKKKTVVKKFMKKIKKKKFVKNL